MLTLLSEVKFLTTRDDINIKDTDFGVFKYTEKKSVTLSNTSQLYLDGKQDYANLRDQHYILHGRKSKQIRISIKRLEDQLKTSRIVYCAWSDNVVLQMLLSNGLLVHICINIFTGDIIRMAFDRFFIGKLISESITDVIMTRMHIIISYDVNQITFVYLQKPNLKRSAPEKISRMDPKIFNIIVSGSQTRKIPRHLACNNSYDLLAIWTKSSQNEVYPWRPTVRDQDRANLHIYRLSRNKLDLLCYCWTENDPINVEFSRLNHNQLRSVEQRISRKGEVNIEICVYEVNKTKIQRTSVTSIPLQAQVCCHSFSPDNEKLMLGCIDGSVILFDEGRGITHLIKAAFIATHVTWHADSAILMIANEKCQVQYFDISLSCLRNQVISEDASAVNVLDLSAYFSAQPSLLQISCSKKPDLTQYGEKYIQSDSFVLVLFENGPMAMIRLLGGNGLKGDVHTSGFTADVLIHQYLNLNNVEKAINVLLCLNWDTYGSMLALSLHKIANYIFKQPFQPEREAQLQKALGSFHIPVKPLCEETMDEFGDQVRDITRKFFQYLLQHKSYEKAFNLAIDIDDEDLFMDLHNCAKADNQEDLAEDAFRKAEEILSRPDSRQDSHSTCSRDSCSICESNSSADDESEKSGTGNEPNTKAKTTTADSQSKEKPIEPVAMAKTMKYRKNVQVQKSSDAIDASQPPKTRFNIPKPELKVSHYARKPQKVSGKKASVSHYGPSRATLSRSASEADFAESKVTNNFSANYANHLSSTELADPLKYQPTQIEKIRRPMARVPFAAAPQMLQPIPQHHHVVDIVPKPPTRPADLWTVPDQTVGIPITNPVPILHGYHDMPPIDPALNYPRQTILMPSHMQFAAELRPMLMQPKATLLMGKQPKTMHTMHQPVIHHPLVSGHIPSFVDNYLIKTQMPLDGPPLPLPPKPRHPAASSILATSTTQQNAQSKRENGERNKVKFSDTVTVAVVPEIPRKDKFIIKKTGSNGFQRPHGMDPRRELQDSLPLCHPNDDYLKDFQPISLQDGRQSPKSASNHKESVLTWV